MSNEDIVRMLEHIQAHTFCEEANRTFEECQEIDCTECQIEFCKKSLSEGYTLLF